MREGQDIRRVRIQSKTVKKEKQRNIATNDRQSAKGILRAIPLGKSLPNVTKMMEELQDMTDVLLGRKNPPINAGTITLMEVADAYFARASEMTMLIQKGEREGIIGKGSNQYKFRTGELRTFLEMAKRAGELGSRRLTNMQLEFEMSATGHQFRGKIPD